MGLWRLSLDLLRSSLDLDLLDCDDDLAAARSEFGPLLDCEFDTNLIILRSCLDLDISCDFVMILEGDL